jgi:predicted nucleic acid-binding protein
MLLAFGFSPEIQENLWLFIERGGLEIFPLEKEHYPLCRDLMRQYKDLPMDLADATLVAMAHSLRVVKVLTLDHKDFFICRVKQNHRVTLIPSKLQ